jgi:hypothetical protein
MLARLEAGLAKLVGERSMTKTVARPWSDLRGISNSNAAKSTILIPLVGYWILFNVYIVKWLHLAEQVDGAAVSSDQIPKRILWFYMGLCLVAVGTFVYAVRCPPEVKKYGDFKDYVNGDGPALTLGAVQDIKESLRGTHDIWAKDDHKDILMMHFDYLNMLHPMSRLTVSMCFLFGFLILGLLSLQVFFRIVRTMAGM